MANVGYCYGEMKPESLAMLTEVIRNARSHAKRHFDAAVARPHLDGGALRFLAGAERALELAAGDLATARDLLERWRK